MASSVACVTKTSRLELEASVSAVPTLMPCPWASVITGAMESGSFGATMRASTRCCMRERTTSLWAAGSAVVGPL